MKYKAVVKAWLQAGKELHIRVEAPYQLKDSDGQIYECIAYIPYFGGKEGTILIAATMPGFDYDEKIMACAKENGFYFSVLNVDEYSKFKKEEFIATLNDWGYFGTPNLKPSWYNGIT